MGRHRRRLKQNDSLEQRFAAAAKLLRKEAAILPAGFDRDALLRKARQAHRPSAQPSRGILRLDSDASPPDHPSIHLRSLRRDGRNRDAREIAL